jgi:hypothetical protein
MVFVRHPALRLTIELLFRIYFRTSNLRNSK